MALKTNLKSLAPRREAFKKELILLSKGAGNRQAWPGGKLTVYPWDSNVDDLIINGAKRGGPRNLLFEVLDKVCDLRGAMDDFYSDEINLVLLASRAQASSGHIVYTATCPNPACGSQEQHTVSVPDELEPIAEKTESWPGYDDVRLPESGDHVRVHPLKIKDEKLLSERKPEQRALVPDSILRILMHISAVSADGTDWGQPGALDELVTWYNALSPTDAKHLEREQRNLSPHANALMEHKCDVCSRQYTHLLTFDTDFFR